MRESLAHALSGPVSLQEDEWRERPVDRLHALAAAQVVGTSRQSRLSALGVSLIALKAANRPDEWARAVDRLAECLAWTKPRPSVSLRMRASRQAIQEFTIDFCPTCKGTGEIPAHDGLEGAQRMRPCPECGGHGKRRYTDRERALALELDDHRLMSRVMADAMGLIAAAEDEAIRTAQRLLERW